MLIDINSFSSLCKPTQKIIKSRDNRSPCEHRAINVNRCLVRQFKVDGQIFQTTETKKCDFLVTNDSKKDAYLIELKGTNILAAIEQLETSYRLLFSSFSDYQMHFRIISKSNTHAVHSSAFLKFRLKHKDVICRTSNYEEYI